MVRHPEYRENFWMLVVAPLIWAAHFLLSYVTAAIWCAKVGGSLGEVRTAIAVFTAVALAGIGFVGWRGYRRHRLDSAAVPHDTDSPKDRHLFMGFATLLLSGLSAVATIYVALTALFVESCY